MSMFGAAIGNALAGLGGTGAAAAIVAGGLAVGALGGGFIAAQGGGGQPATSSGKLAVYACPDSGEPVAMVPGGQKLLATGRTADSTWLRIHFPDPGRTEAWIQASPVQVKGAVDSLPVAECLPELAVVAPSFAPAATLTVAGDNPATPSPTPSATPTPPPTVAPTANARPALAGLAAFPSKISYDTGDYCPSAAKKVTFKVKATDAAGVDKVALFWRKPGAGGFTQAVMTRVAGSAKSGTWQVTLDTTANGITEAGKLAYYAVATDTGGATRKIPASGSNTITVAVCVNTGPAITGASSSSGKNLSWDPLGVGRCQTATDITATVKDPDGVKSVTLFYRRPGGSWDSKPMNNTTLRGKWYANLDTLGDKITIPDPPTGTLRWYIKAVDAKGKTSQTSTASITIRRCDSEAVFDGVFPQGQTYSCSNPARITLGTYANDEDQPNDGLKVVFHWTLSNPRTGAGPISGKMTANLSKGNYYQGVTSTFNGQTFYAGRLTAYVVTTDRYGGTTKSPVDGPYTMQCSDFLFPPFGQAAPR